MAERRSETTKAAILEAARERFAADGYERATIRAIAASAAIDPALVIRYFGSKDALFAAAAHFDLRLPDLRAVPHDSLGLRLAEHFLERWETDDTFLALLRAAVTNEAAAERMRDVFARQVMPAVIAVAGPGAGARLRVALISSQFLGLAITRFVLRVPGIATMGRAQLARHVAPVIQSLLAGDARE